MIRVSARKKYHGSLKLSPEQVVSSCPEQFR